MATEAARMESHIAAVEPPAAWQEPPQEPSARAMKLLGQSMSLLQDTAADHGYTTGARDN